MLLSGDEDIRVGVQQAQEYGVRVHLLGIAPSRGNQSTFLLQEADTTSEWDAADLDSFMVCHPGTTDPVSATPPWTDSDEGTVLVKVARQAASDVPPAEVEALVQEIRSTNQRPKQIDARLLATSRGALGCDLDSAQKRRVRDAYLRELEGRLTTADRRP